MPAPGSRCYDCNQGRLTGSTDGRVARFQWVEDQRRQSGTAIMALAADGEHLNGYWYEGGAYQGLWYGERVRGEELDCEVSLGAGDLEEKLDRGDSAILYGLHFDFDSARLGDESRETLTQLLELLEARPDLRVRLVGHTDSVGARSYNRELSRKRAGAVRGWLVERGVDPARLEARGRGEAEPLAGNDTPQGRALNRRVEIVPVGGGGADRAPAGRFAPAPRGDWHLGALSSLAPGGVIRRGRCPAERTTPWTTPAEPSTRSAASWRSTRPGSP